MFENGEWATRIIGILSLVLFAHLWSTNLPFIGSIFRFPTLHVKMNGWLLAPTKNGTDQKVWTHGSVFFTCTLSITRQTFCYLQKKKETSQVGYFWVSLPETNILLMEEILHQLIWVVCTSILQGFLHPRWLFGISEPSTVAPDNWWFPRGLKSLRVFRNMFFSVPTWGLCFPRISHSGVGRLDILDVWPFPIWF